MSTPGAECPDCGARLTGRRCPDCGWQAATVREDQRPAWHCDRCHVEQPHGGALITMPDGAHGRPQRLCGGCHFAVRVAPYKSDPGDRCIAPECQNDPPHLVRAHVAALRELVGKIFTGQAATTRDERGPRRGVDAVGTGSAL